MTVGPLVGVSDVLSLSPPNGFSFRSGSDDPFL